MNRILVIEDDMAILENILEILSYENYDVVGATNGIEGLEMVADFQPNLIICDIMMPELDGYGVLMELQKNRTLMMTPFIFLTAKASRADMRLGMDMGADDYLIKPFSMQELLEMVKTRLELSRIRQETYEQRMDDLRQSVMYSLPHELRTPLTSILGYTALLIEDLEKMKPTAALNMLMGIQQAGARLYRLLENYLLYAQLEVLATDPQRVATLSTLSTENVKPIIEKTARRQAESAERSADLVLNVAEASVKMTENHLQRIVEELLDNAFKFSPPGTPVSVQVSANEQFMLEVRDKGYGMEPEQITQIGAYMQFNRRLYEQQGIGLGLVNAKRLAELHRGTLEIKSQLDEGTTVTVALPR